MRRNRRGSASNSASAGPDRLEVEHVEELALEDHLEDLRGRRRRIGVRHAHVEEGRDAVGVEAPHLPDHHGPPVVADEGGPVVAVVVEQPAQVAGQVVGAVVGDLGRARAPAVAAQVRRIGAVAGVGQRAELMAPRVPELREAVAQDDGGAVGRPRHRHVQLDPVRRHLLVRHLSHGASPSPSRAALSAFSSWCFWMADMTALPAAPMNSGRFSAAQSRLDVSDAAESWNWGAT